MAAGAGLGASGTRATASKLSPYTLPEYVKDCEVIWTKMKDLNETAKGAFFMTHDGYLKLWQLQEPKPCLWYQYDVIFIDEAQDCNPAIMDVLLAQRCAKVLVGDPHQQIYTFRGAVNALHTAPHTHIFYLTQGVDGSPERVDLLVGVAHQHLGTPLGQQHVHDGWPVTPRPGSKVNRSREEPQNEQ
ncbi:hypothetical protein CRUP_022174 [Coryphaenoides rupestris]|nr:hypothetical protein CRUP_022174 [Coryphaenoides rupestris]